MRPTGYYFDRLAIFGGRALRPSDQFKWWGRYVCGQRDQGDAPDWRL